MMNGVCIWDIVTYDKWCGYLGHCCVGIWDIVAMMNDVGIWDIVTYDEWCGYLGHCCL